MSLRSVTGLRAGGIGLLAALVLALVWACGEPRHVARGPEARDGGTLAAQVVEHPAGSLDPRVRWHAGARERAPMSLTAGDGTGLRLVALRGTVVIEDPIAFTELHLSFDNPEDRRREGRFELDLPPGAAISRLAMKIGDRFMEGEIVERRSGQATYESYVHDRPRVDPMLLETAGGDRVAARVFPIEPRQRKEIIVSYSQSLSAGPFRLPLAGLPTIDELDVQVVVKTSPADPRDPPDGARAMDQRVIEVSQRDVAPHEDLVVSMSGAGDAAAVRSGDLAVLRVRPDSAERSAPLSGLTILFDTSASGARGFDREVDRLVELLATLGDVPVRVVAFDQGTEVLYDGSAAAAGADVRAGVRERRAFGASNLHAALEDPAVRTAAHPRLLVWSDGIATAGPTTPRALRAAARALAAEGVLRIDALAVGASRDRSTLEAIAGAAAWTGSVITPDLGGEEIARRLRRASYEDVAITVEGATWSWPTTLHGLSPGDDITVYAAFDGPAPASLRVDFDDPGLAAHRVAARDGAAPLVARALAWARIQAERRAIDELGPDGAEKAQQARARIVELSQRHRVLSDFTAMLVLESEREYARFGIERRSVADILTVGPGGVALLRRGETRLGTELAQAWGEGELFGTEIGEARGTGGLGLVGTGRGGGGIGDAASGGIVGLLGGSALARGEGTIGLGSAGIIGHGAGSGTGSGYGRGEIGLGSVGGDVGWGSGAAAGFGGRGKRIPQVRIAEATVTGALDKDIVRRIVRAHINEVRFCYRQALERQPKLGGRLVVEFAVDTSGNVLTATVADTEIADASVGACITRAVRRWRFPSPTGTVTVRFPFVLSPDAGVSTPSGWRARTVARRRPTKRGRARTEPWSGRFGAVQTLLARGESLSALDQAFEWATTSPDDALAIVALGDALREGGQAQLAARVYGSLVDLHPERADLRRAAAARLSGLGPEARALAIDIDRQAIALRPDQPSGYRQLAWALAREERWEEAFATLREGLDAHWPSRRFAGAKAVLRQDLALVAAAWRASAPDPTAVEAAVKAAGVTPEATPSLHLVAHWETDATDVDLTVKPAARGASRGRRLADVRTGLGPEAWVARGERTPDAVIATVHYYERGAMGAALGVVEAIAHDGQGHLRFHAQPFTLTEAGGALELPRIEI